MGKKRKELSHEEIWDDGGLVQSWNESYEEYKRYHSIAARGERVKDVLDTTSREQATSPTSAKPLLAETMSDGIREVGGSEDQRHGDENRPDNAGVEAPPLIVQNGTLEKDAKTAVDEQEPTEVPESMLTSSSNDQALKSLMMSWYWAGYYTGLYEGQRSAAPPTESPPPTEKT